MMHVFVSNREIEQIANGLVDVSCGQLLPRRIDIDVIARFLGLTVLYERIVEDDQDKIGFLSNGDYPLTVLRNGERVGVFFPKDTIVLEEFLQRPGEDTRRRFVLAHEISHFLLNRADPMQNPACFNRAYDNQRDYNIQELRKRMNLAECQANSMAAHILMPRPILTAAIQRYFQADRIPIYGDCVFLPSMKPAIQGIAIELGVSYTTLLIQLKKYDLLEQRDMQEYFQRLGGFS